MNDKKFKEGDIVYRKATKIRGVIKKAGNLDDWVIAWADNRILEHCESELYTEQEYKNEFSGF